MDLSDIRESYSSYVNESIPRRSMIDRYFVRRYCLGSEKKLSEDFCILEHSNGICIVTLAASHPIVHLKKIVTRVNYQADAKTSRLDNKVSGKLKRGAQCLTKNSALCHITCDDGTIYTVSGCIQASLVEVNEHLITNPQLLVEKPETLGFVAILLTRKNEHEREMAKLLTAEQYEKSVIERASSSVDTEQVISPT